MLLRTFLEISAEWRACFPQQRTHLRALRQGLGGLVCVGRRTLARIIWTNGRRAAQLERRVFFALAMPLAPATAVRADLAESLAVLSRAIGRRGDR